MADADGRLNQTDRDGNLPLPCSFMDIHICGACKTQFNNVELFIAHKQQSCPVFVEIRSISFDHLATTSAGIAQTTSPNVTVPGSLPLTTGTTNSIASSIVTPSLAENITTFSNHPVAGSVQINGPHPGDEVESNGHLIHRLHRLTNTIDRQNDHADQSLSTKLELSFLDVQQVVREELKNRNNSKDPFLLSSATNSHHLIGQSQNAANLMGQKTLQAEEDHNTVSLKLSHGQKANHIAEVISRPSQITTSKQLMHTFELNSSCNTSSPEQVLVKSVQHEATATTTVPQHFFADQIITEPLDNLAAIASNDLQTGQQPQLTTNFPLRHQESQQSLDNEANVEIVSSVPSSSLSLSVINAPQSSNSTEDSYELRMMTSTDGASSVQVPTRSYMAIVEEFEVSPTSNTMLNECETQPASLIQQPPPPAPPPPPDESQQQHPPPLQTRHPTPQSHASVHINGELSNNFDTDRGSTSLLVLRNDTDQLQPVLPLTNFLASTQASTKQPSATNVNKVSLKNRQAPKKKFKCTFGVCEFQTAYLKDLERHTRTHTGERPFQCQVCRKSFNRSDKLKIHQRVHTGNKPYQCQICSYSSVDSSSLKKHMRIHTNERPFKCQMCSYASRNSSQLIVHLRTHTGDSPFQCQLCDAKFKINSDLKRHVRTHTGEKPFKCEFCDYRCSIKANLKSHHYRINHSTENQFQCGTCSFTSPSRKMYKEHMKTHDTDRPIKCLLCMYKCSRKSALITHLRTHSDERPVRCDFCTYTSKQNSNVKTHMKKKHAEKLRQKKKNASHKSSEPVKKIGEVEVATSSSIDDINGGQERIKLNCKKAYNCQQCDASFVRQDSLLSHVRQHQNIEKALQSTAMAVLQLQNPVRPLNQQFSSNTTPDGANQVPSEHTLNSSKAGSEQCLTPTLPAISTSVTVSKSVSNSASLFSSTSPISSRLTPKTSKDNLSFQQSHLNISNVSDGQIPNQENHSLLNGLSSSQKSLLSSFSQPVNIASIPSNNSSCSQQPQPTESIQSCLNISQNNQNIVSMVTDTDDPKEIISQNSMNHNTSVSNNLIQLEPQQKRITDSIGQCLHENMISSPVSTMATTSQTNVSQVLPSSVTSPGVSTNAQSVVNSYLLNSQPQQGTIVAPQFLQNLTALQLISNVSLPFFRMPTAQMSTQTTQFLSQPHEQINVMSSPLSSTLNTPQQQQAPAEIPVQIISQRNQQQNTIPVNVQISPLNFDATAAAIRNEILDQCSSGAMIASFQVIVPQHMQPVTAANTVPQVCTLASAASSLDSAAPASIPASTRGEILVQVSSCPHTSHNSLCLPSDQSSHSSTNPATATPITSLPTNLISVSGHSLPTTADATDPHCK